MEPFRNMVWNSKTPDYEEYITDSLMLGNAIFYKPNIIVLDKPHYMLI